MAVYKRNRIFQRIIALTLLLLLVGPSTFASEIKWLQSFPQSIGEQTILMWMPIPAAKYYTITRRAHSTNKAVTWEVSQTHYIDSRAKTGAGYSYQISAYDARGIMIGKSEIVELAETLPLAVPTWSGTYQDNDKLFLLWEGDSHTLYYNLFKRGAGEEVTLIAAVSVGKYVDHDITIGESYEYFIKAVDEIGEQTEASDILVVEVESWFEEQDAATAAFSQRLVEPVMLIARVSPDLKEPTEIVLFKRNLYVSDLGSRSVVVMGLDGKFVRRYASEPNSYEGQWGIPWGLGIDPNGRKFAATFLKSPNVRVFDWQGKLLLDILVGLPPEFETNQKHVSYLPVPQPMDVAVTEDGSLWVTDYAYGQVIRYNSKGREIGRSGIPKGVKGSGPFSTPNFLVQHLTSGEFNVVDSLRGKIHRLSPEGEILGAWGREVGQQGALTLPKGIANGLDDEILVVDGMFSTLQAFGSKGNLVAVYRSVDEERAPLPLGIISAAVDPDTGDIYLTTKIDSAIYRYILQE